MMRPQLFMQLITSDIVANQQLKKYNTNKWQIKIEEINQFEDGQKYMNV